MFSITFVDLHYFFQIEWERNKIPPVKICEACKKNSLHPETSVKEQECVDYQEVKLQVGKLI